MQNKHIPYIRILIIKPGAIGDLLQLTPLIRALKQSNPLSEITILVGSETTAELFRNNPNISDIIVFDRTNHPPLTAFLQKIRSKRFDLVLNFQRSNMRSWLIVAACLPARVLVYHKKRKRIMHAVANYLETIAPLKISAPSIELDFFPDQASMVFAENIFREMNLDRSRVIALNPGATHAVNRWPTYRFSELADLLSEHLSIKPLIIGGQDDIELANEIIKNSRSHPVSIAGKTSLSELGAVLKKCALLVSGDTGPMHLAAAVGTPVVALFGAADPARTGPVGINHRVIQSSSVQCVPCRKRTCSSEVYMECMETISPVEVLNTIEGMIQSKQ